jgi:hypothetical protein
MEASIFHGLVDFYKRFIKNFGGMYAPLTDCKKGQIFTWTKAAERTFEQFNKKVTKSPILTLPDFEKLFPIECNVSVVSIGGVLR